MAERLSEERIEEASSTMKSATSNMETILLESKSKMESINDPDVWKSPAAAKLYESFQELSKDFPKFVDASTTFSTFLDTILLPKTREFEEKKIKEQETLVM